MFYLDIESIIIICISYSSHELLLFFLYLKSDYISKFIRQVLLLLTKTNIKTDININWNKRKYELKTCNKSYFILAGCQGIIFF